MNTCERCSHRLSEAKRPMALPNSVDLKNTQVMITCE